MNAILITPPVLEPVAVYEVKDHLRISHFDEDALLESLAISAREYVENVTRRAIMTQTWDYFLDEFPDGDSIVLPFGNLQTVTHVKYTDSDGDQSTMTVTTEYLVETNGTQHGRIVLPTDVSWPTDVLYPSNPIVIRFICGWTTQALVPRQIKAAIMMTCADLYENRGERLVGPRVQFVVENKTADYLLASQRLWGAF
jgi:uncharacterized phiE125 gp8 family phage protein